MASPSPIQTSSGSSRQTPRITIQFLVGGLFVLAAVALILPGLGLAERHLRQRLEEARVDGLRRMMDGVLRGVGIRVEAAEMRVSRLARLLSDAPAGADPALVHAFDSLVRRDPDGAWRSRRDRFDPEREAGVFLPAFTPVTPEFKAFVMRARRLTGYFGAGTLDPLLADAWVSPEIGGQIIFVTDQPDYVYEERADQDYRNTEWLQLARPDGNPRGEVRWTNPYHGAKTDAWFVSVLSPYTVGGRYAGSVGQDLSPAELVDYSAQTPFEAGARFLLIGPKGGILFADTVSAGTRTRPEGQSLEDLPDFELRDTLSRLLTDSSRSGPGARVQVRTSSAYLIGSRLPGTGWLAVALIPRSAVVAPLTEPLRTARWSVLGGLVLLSIASLVAITREIRRRASIEADTRRAEEHFRGLFQLSPDAVAVTREVDGRCIDVNPSFVHLSGFRREELVGQRTLDLGLWVDPADRAAVIETLGREGVCRDLPLRMRVQGGTILRVEFSARRIELAGEQCLLAIIRDVEEQRQLEQRLELAQRMEAVGRLAGGIAHDFNNIMTAVMGYAQLALEGQPAESQVAGDLREILKASTRANELTRRLLAFSRRQVTQPRNVDVNALVLEIRSLAERLLRADIRLDTILGDGLPPVRLDPVQFEQVLVNLIVNARDAMPNGGVVSLRTRQEAGGLLVEVSDTGTGIPVEHQPRIFEPFFTTKDVGKGSGLGLATCYAIVQQAGGRIEFTSTAGQGTTFRILLPPSMAGSPASTGGEDRPEALPGGLSGDETILVAEDEAPVRDLIVRALSGLGYRVLTASDGIEALRVAEAHAGEIHLLVSDVIMPGLRGPDLVHELRQQRPELRALLLSGYTTDADAVEQAVQRGDGFLTKPFAVADLASAVRVALRRPG